MRGKLTLHHFIDRMRLLFIFHNPSTIHLVKKSLTTTNQYYQYPPYVIKRYWREYYTTYQQYWKNHVIPCNDESQYISKCLPPREALTSFLKSDLILFVAILSF